MENLVPSYIKTIENITTLKLNDDLWISVKCYVPESKFRQDGSIMESGVMYWSDHKTKFVSFYSQLSSSIFIKFKQSNESIMIIARNKFLFTRFLEKMLKLCKDKSYYVFRKGVLAGINMENIREAQKEFALSQKMDKVVYAQPIVIKNSSKTSLANGIGISLNKSDASLTIDELEVLIDHIKSIDLITFTQNAINSLQWKISQFSRVHTQGINEYKLKIKMLISMDKEEMVGLAKGMDLDVSELVLLKEKQVRQTLIEFFKSEIKRLTGEV